MSMTTGERTMLGARLVDTPGALRQSTVRVLVAGAWALLRSGLSALLAAEPDLQVVAEADIDDNLVTTAVRLRPDVVLLDIDRPDGDGLDAVSELHDRLPTCGVVVLTTSNRPGLLRRALDAHALGFVDKDADSGRLAVGIRHVANGEQVIDPSLAVAAFCAADSPFTARELDVLRIADEGASAPEIARRLCLTCGTVRNYLSRIMGKTGARTRLEALRIAHESGWF